MYETFTYLLEAYFFQCWRAEHSTWQKAIITFKKDEVQDNVSKLIIELEYLIENQLAEEAIASTGRFVTPFIMDGLTAHDWCVEVLRTLQTIEIDINIKYFLESKKPINAEGALRHHLKINDLNYQVGKVEPYLDKGCVCICTFQVQATTWQALVYEIIRECQNFGCGWHISNRIDEELCLTTSRFHGGRGIIFADVYVDRKSEGFQDKLTC